MRIGGTAFILSAAKEVRIYAAANTIRCERASTALNGLPRLVERGGQDADFFGIEDARLGVYFKKLVHCPRFLPGL